jgi:hypothetical protein
VLKCPSVRVRLLSALCVKFRVDACGTLLGWALLLFRFWLAGRNGRTDKSLEPYCARVWNLVSNLKLFKTENTKIRNCSNLKLFKTKNIQIQNCSKPKMFKFENVQNRKCSKPKMFKFENVQIWNCQNLNFFKFGICSESVQNLLKFGIYSKPVQNSSIRKNLLKFEKQKRKMKNKIENEKPEN